MPTKPQLFDLFFKSAFPLTSFNMPLWFMGMYEPTAQENCYMPPLESSEYCLSIFRLCPSSALDARPVAPNE